MIELSRFQALMTTSAATIGTGNIVGVSTAIAIGGPGALFWNLADILNGLMAVPNLIGLLGLSGIVVAETRRYLRRQG